jgi:hypothetical protein
MMVNYYICVCIYIYMRKENDGKLLYMCMYIHISHRGINVD